MARQEWFASFHDVMTLHAVFSASAIVIGHEFVKTIVFAQIIR